MPASGGGSARKPRGKARVAPFSQLLGSSEAVLAECRQRQAAGEALGSAQVEQLIAALASFVAATNAALAALPRDKGGKVQRCGGGTASSSGPIPDTYAKSEADLPQSIPVFCKDISGTLHPGPMTIVCGCPTCEKRELDDPARAFWPSPWEKHCGSLKSKKWSRAIKMLKQSDGSLIPLYETLYDFFLKKYGVTFDRGAPRNPPTKVFASDDGASP